MLRLLVVCLVLLGARAQVTAPPGFISQTQYVSCTQFKGTLDCGNTDNQVTVLSLAIIPGTGSDVTYRFQSLTNIASSTDVLNGAISCPDGSCSITQQYEVVVSTKPLLVYYQATPWNSNPVPYFYSAHHSNAFWQPDSGDDRAKDYECGGEAQIRSYKPSQVTPTSKLTEVPAWKVGVEFSELCSIEYGDMTYGSGIANCGYTVGKARTCANKNSAFPYAWKCKSMYGDEMHWPPTACGFSEESTVQTKEELYSQIYCPPRVPSFLSSNANNAACPYFMTLWNGRYEFPLRYDRRYFKDDCGNPGLPDMQYTPSKANKMYENGRIGTCTYGYPVKSGYDAFEDFRDLQELYSDPLYPDYVQMVNRCGRLYGYLTDHSPCQQYYGSYYYQGGVKAKHIPNWLSTLIVDQDQLMTWTVQPVIIGCGLLFADTGLHPKTLSDGSSNYFKSDQQIYPATAPNREKKSNVIPACGTNDDFCCSGSIGNVDAKGGRGVPFALCRPTDKCTDDRKGIIETGSNPELRYYTGDTMGTSGPTCTVNYLQQTAKPMFEATATLYLIKPTGGREFLGNSTVNNISYNDYAGLFGDIAANTRVGTDAASRSSTFNFGGSQSKGQPNLNSVLSLEFDYFDTPNGQIAPDLFPTNVMFCNTTDKTSLIYMSDPSNPFVNPWTIADRFVNKATGGYTPLPRNLWRLYEYVNAEARNTTLNANLYQWFYFDTAINDYGGGLGQLGSTPDVFNDNVNANTICKKSRYFGVPGWLQNVDWTIQDRITDIKLTSGREERKLRNQLINHTPCVVAGYFADYEQQTTCTAFRNYDSRGLQHLLPTWVPDSIDTKCPLPRCWVNGMFVFCSTDSVSNNNIRAEMRLAILGELISIQTVIAPGKLVVDGSHPLACSVDQNSNNGVLSIYVRNTGTTTGSYQVYGNCTGAIQVFPSLVTDLAGGDIVRQEVVVSHSGVIPAETKCDIYLTNPTYTNLLLSQVSTDACQVSRVGEAPIITFEQVNPECNIVTGKCVFYDPGQVANNSRGFAGWITFVTIAVILIGAVILVCVLSDANDKTKIKIKQVTQTKH